MARKPRKKFIAAAIKHPGALDRDVGGPAHEHLDRVRQMARHGTPEQRRRANFYLSVLRPASKRRRRKR